MQRCDREGEREGLNSDRERGLHREGKEFSWRGKLNIERGVKN